MGVPSGGTFSTIPIDLEVLRELTARLEGPNDNCNAVLRRMLELESVSRAEQMDPAGEPWVCDGVIFPPGTDFRASYRGQLYSGRVERGALVVNGERFLSPSRAASSITGTSVNGWKFWECLRGDDTKWVAIDGLRKR